VTIKKMGSRQKAIKAFLVACDDTMLDRWIPGGRAHFLDDQDAVALLFLQDMPVFKFATASEKESTCIPYVITCA
jgi:hypothetical protein